ncbi:MAG: hypothetical protein ACI4AA_00665 [Lachnospiraceae bacterium]
MLMILQGCGKTGQQEKLRAEPGENKESIENEENLIPEKLLGEWRVSRIILLPKVWRTDLIISYNYGRTITITESEIVDSLDPATMGSNDWDYQLSNWKKLLLWDIGIMQQKEVFRKKVSSISICWMMIP